MSNQHALFQLGIDLDQEPSTSLTEDKSFAPGMTAANQDHAVPLAEARKDFFIRRDGQRYAGTHLIIDLWGAEGLDSLAHVEATLKECVTAAGATLLHIHLHHFTPNDGISGVAVLAESHISIHTWPESGYAALDVFMCGDAEPHQAVEVLRRNFRPERVDVTEHLRGRGL